MSNTSVTFNYLGTSEVPFDKELTSDFIDEAMELLAEAERILIDMEHTNSGKSVNPLFRVFHTLKANSSQLQLREFIKMLHKMEHKIEPSREEGLPLLEDMINSLLGDIDTLRVFVGILRQRASDI